MKKMTKILLSCAAVATVSAAMATAAFAETTATVTKDGTTAGTYDIGTATITITDNPQTDAETTYVVVDDTITGSITEENKEGVKAIDQVATTDALTIKTNLSTTAPEAGEYEIRVGGTDGSITKYVLKITDDTEPPKSDRKLGDVVGKHDIDNCIDGDDALAIAEYNVRSRNLTGDDLQAADVDDGGTADGDDALQVAQYSVKMESVVDGVKTVGDKTKTVPERQ